MFFFEVTSCTPAPSSKRAIASRAKMFGNLKIFSSLQTIDNQVTRYKRATAVFEARSW